MADAYFRINGRHSKSRHLLLLSSRERSLNPSDTAVYPTPQMPTPSRVVRFLWPVGGTSFSLARPFSTNDKDRVLSTKWIRRVISGQNVDRPDLIDDEKILVSSRGQIQLYRPLSVPIVDHWRAIRTPMIESPGNKHCFCRRVFMAEPNSIGSGCT